MLQIEFKYTMSHEETMKHIEKHIFMYYFFCYTLYISLVTLYI